MKKVDNDIFFAWVESEIEAGHAVRFRLKGNSMYPPNRSVETDGCGTIPL